MNYIYMIDLLTFYAVPMNILIFHKRRYEISELCPKLIILMNLLLRLPIIYFITKYLVKWDL